MIRALAWFVAIASAVIASQSVAHTGHVVLGAERYLKLVVMPGRARLVVVWTLGAARTAEVLRAIDRDRDGRFSRAELDRFSREWRDERESSVRLLVDGERARLQFRRVVFSPPLEGRAGATSLSIEVAAHAAFDRRASHVFSVSATDREPFERTDVALRAERGASHAPDVLDEPADLVFGPLERSVSARYTVRAPTSVRPSELAGVAGVLASIFAVRALVSRARRRRAPASRH